MKRQKKLQNEDYFEDSKECRPDTLIYRNRIEPNSINIFKIFKEFEVKKDVPNEKWSFNAIKLVGNYAEIYERQVGPNTPLKLDRGLNALYTNGGLMYAPPIK